MRAPFAFYLTTALLGSGLTVSGAELPPADREFFEQKIRPVLVAECYECHDAKKQKGELRLDYAAALLKGGETGPAIIAGNAKLSLLIQTITHEHQDLHMPKKRPQLDAKIIADFTEWVNRGAPDPRLTIPTESIQATWSDLLSVRKNWWSFQPVKTVAVPAGTATSGIDRFLEASQNDRHVPPSPPADKRTLIRRATYTLTGLPPTTSEIDAFVADNSAAAFAKVVDRLLASPRYGEHFARHWMDLVRYADTHGSEGDPTIPQAWRYRDYLIRAFNADVPYDQFVREQIAGDLLPNPRLNPTDQLNESALGTGHFRLIEYGYQPVDTVDEQVRNVDNQIDVVTKTFLGLTVSCARCHNHKFDAISQADFYAFYGIFASSRPGQVTVDAPAVLDQNRAQLTKLKALIRAELAQEWRQQAEALPAHLARLQLTSGERSALEEQIRKMKSQLAAVSFQGKMHGAPSVGPAPTHGWTFEQDGRDLVGNLEAKLMGGATIRGGRLILDGETAFAQTDPIAETYGPKTLEVWVVLPTLAQQGGGVLALESIGGGVFDSIVFAEKQPARWMAGSDNHVRSQSVTGPAETTQPNELIHIAIVYETDGQIALYRNGQPYGKGYSPANAKSKLQAFTEGKAHLLFGRRHTGGGKAFLKAELEEARLYATALTPAEVAASFRTGILQGDAVSSTPTDNAAVTKLKKDLAKHELQLAAIKQTSDKLITGLGPEEDPTNPLHAATFTRVGLRPKTTPEPRQDQPDWNLASPQTTPWNRHGNGMEARITPGDFRVESEGPAVLSQLLPSGLHSHTLSTKHSAVLTSPRFEITTDFISVQVLGRGATLRLIPDNYPLSPGGSRFPKATVNKATTTWVTLDTAYRKGSFGYLELTLPADSTNPEGNSETARGWFGVREVVFHTSRASGPSGPAVITKAPAYLNIRELVTALDAAAQAWGKDQADEAQVALLDAALRHGLLVAGSQLTTELTALVTEYRKLEEAIKPPRRAPGFLEATGFDQPLYVRGDYKKSAEIIPRRYLEAFDATPFQTMGTGRLQLAAKISTSSNPLTARVMVNRLWYHTFGRGLVGTVDNFGRLGDLPTHPELLDYLSQQFINQQWSVKAMLRELMLTAAYQRSSRPTADARKLDAANDLLSHMNVRRLEGEALRDTLLTFAGQIEHRMYGPGDNALASPKGQNRRSVYLTIRRNTLNPLITAFDGPKPFTTVGRRDTTNVPAQSLTLLNDPFVLEISKRWAASLAAPASDERKVEALFLQALGRPAEASEHAVAQRYLADLRREPGSNEVRVWQDFAQAMLNLKEFLYIK